MFPSDDEGLPWKFFPEKDEDFRCRKCKWKVHPIHVADGMAEDFDFQHIHLFYVCVNPDCPRDVMMFRRAMDTIIDKEGRI